MKQNVGRFSTAANAKVAEEARGHHGCESCHCLLLTWLRGQGRVAMLSPCGCTGRSGSHIIWGTYISRGGSWVLRHHQVQEWSSKLRWTRSIQNHKKGFCCIIDFVLPTNIVTCSQFKEIQQTTFWVCIYCMSCNRCILNWIPSNESCMRSIIFFCIADALLFRNKPYMLFRRQPRPAGIIAYPFLPSQ